MTIIRNTTVLAAIALAACSPKQAPTPPAPVAAVAAPPTIVAHFPASRDDLAARLKKADTDMPPLGAWRLADRETLARDARSGFPPEYRATMDPGQLLDVYQNADGSLREIMIKAPAGTSNSTAETTIIRLVYAVAPGETSAYSQTAIQALNEARQTGQFGRYPVGGVWVGIYPASDGGFNVWATPSDKLELAAAALQASLHKDDNGTVAEATGQAPPAR